MTQSAVMIRAKITDDLGEGKLALWIAANEGLGQRHRVSEEET